MRVNWKSSAVGPSRQFAVVLLACALAAVRPAHAAQTDVRRDATVLAIERAMPSVVNIATESVVEYHDFYDQLLRDFYGWRGIRPRQQTRIELGSGVIVDEEGYVLTNLHVVRRATRTQVKLWDGREYDAERIVATPYSDVALLKIKGKPGEKFSAVKFASDDDLFLGETVLALGNPFGLGGTVTKGILSSKTRRPATGNEPLNVNDWLQTDAAINPGNSGGPLLNLRGELIGLNVAVHREGQGIGFAIPVKQVSAALARFFSPEVFDSLWFGARVNANATPLQLAFVQPGSPAQKAGLREGDEIVEVNGQKPTGVISFNRLLGGGQKNDVRLVVNRGAERRNVKVQLVPFEDLIRQKLGLTLLELTAQTAARLGVRAGQGLFIEEVEKNGPADRAKLQRGYLLAEIDGRTLENLFTAADILSDKSKGDRAKLTVVVPFRRGAGFVEYRQGAAEVEVR
jgi:serine protease Do